MTVDHVRRGLLFPRRAAPPIRPPWTSECSVFDACTGCGDCASACPAGIIRLGPGKMPEIDFSPGECTFCGECAGVCAEAVFDVRAPAFDHVAAIGETCLANAGIECRACQDACPEAAIRFRARLSNPPAPKIDDAACTGCGACLAPCPTDAVALTRTAPDFAHA